MFLIGLWFNLGLFLHRFVRIIPCVDYSGLNPGRALNLGLILCWALLSFEFWLAKTLPSCLDLLKNAIQQGLLFVYLIFTTGQPGWYSGSRGVVHVAWSSHRYLYPLGLRFSFKGLRLSEGRGGQPERIMVVDDFSWHFVKSLGGVTLDFKFLSLLSHKGHASLVDRFPTFLVMLLTVT